VIDIGARVAVAHGEEFVGRLVRQQVEVGCDRATWAVGMRGLIRIQIDVRVRRSALGCAFQQVRCSVGAKDFYHRVGEMPPQGQRHVPGQDKYDHWYPMDDRLLYQGPY
jgi:hypothetical protein